MRYITINTILFFVFIVLCSVPGAAPENVRGHNTSSTSILVTWDEVPADKQHGKILKHTVIYKESEGDAEMEKRVDSPARQIELKELKTYTAYSIQVLAATVKGDGPRSETITVWTDQEGTCKYKEMNVKFLAPSWVNSADFQPRPPTKVCNPTEKVSFKVIT